jgi:hypothetical protein
VLIAILVISGVALAVAFGPEKTRERSDQDRAVKTATAHFKNKSLSDLALIKIEPDLIRGHRSNYVEGTFSISNGTDTDIKDVKVTCYFIAPSGTALGDASATVYQVIPSGRARKSPSVSLGYANPQTARYKCDVVDFQYDLDRTRW